MEQRLKLRAAVESTFTEEDLREFLDKHLEVYYLNPGSTPLQVQEIVYQKKLSNIMREKVRSLSKKRAKILNNNNNPSRARAMQLLTEGYPTPVAYPELVEKYNKLRGDFLLNPLNALRHFRGQDQANAIVTFLKTQFMNSLREYHAKHEFDNEGTKSIKDALDALEKALQKSDDPTLSLMIFGVGVQGRRPKWKKHVMASLTEEERREFDVISRGLFEAAPDFNAMNARPSIDGFAREAAARETGREAQKRNPNPRQESSRDKMNRAPE